MKDMPKHDIGNGIKGGGSIYVRQRIRGGKSGPTDRKTVVRSGKFSRPARQQSCVQ